MSLLTGFHPQDAITSRALLHDAGGPANPWQMLVIARASSFVLLLRLSKRRVLHLEVDEVRAIRLVGRLSPLLQFVFVNHDRF